MIEEWQEFEDAPRDRWLLSYADLVTLLLAFFVVMYSVSAVNEVKLAELAESLSASFEASGAEDDGEPNRLQQTPEVLLNELQQIIPNDEVKFELEGPTGQQSIKLSLPGALLFASGETELASEGKVYLTSLLPALRLATGSIRVEGHTDNQPISSGRFPSNWELSAHRAAATVRYLEESGVSPDLLSAVGLGSSDPIANNITEAGRAANRRVVISLDHVDWQGLEQVLEQLEPVPTPGAVIESEIEAEPLDIENIDPALLEELLRQI